MKKRILSFLLVLCMLVAMVPVTAAVAEETGSTESQADVEYASSYLDLYVTDGLTVLFDAGTASSSMITFGEANGSAGTWYGYTVNADGKLEQNENFPYVADPHGGAYNAETNPLGWQKLPGGGVAWYETESNTATDNYLHFKTELLGKAFQVDFVYAPSFRNTADGFIEKEVVYDYDEVIGYDETVGTIIKDATGKHTDAFGLLYEGDEEDADGNTTGKYEYLFVRSTTWNFADAKANHCNDITIYFVDGSAGEELNFTISWGNYAIPSGKTEYDYTVANSTATQSLKVVLDENGAGSITVPLRGRYFQILKPSTSSAWVTKVETYKHLNECGYDQTFVIGNLYGYTWSNLLASNTWGNGFGSVRWTVAKTSWNSGANGNKAMLIDTAATFYDDTTFGQLNNQIIDMKVVNTGSTYTVNYAGKTPLSVALDASKANEDGTYAGANFKVMHRIGGVAYGLRVYSAPLTAFQNNRNYFADLAMAYDLDVTGMDLAKLNNYNYIYSTFASYNLMGEDAEALQAELDELLANDPTAMQTEYDKLYVQNGLVGLYTLLGNDDSVVVEEGKITGWVDKTGNSTPAVVYGSGWTVAANGGLSIAIKLSDWNSSEPTTYVDFDDAYAALPNFTTETVMIYETLTKDDGSGRDTTQKYSGSYTIFRIDLYSGMWFNGASISNRAYLSNNGWGNGGTSKNVMYAVSGQWTAPATGDYAQYNGVNMYVGNGYSMTPGKVYTQTFIKETSATDVRLALTLNGAYQTTSAMYNYNKVNFGGVQTNGRIPLDEYNAAKAHAGSSKSKPFSLLNGIPGTLYAVRVYDRVLTDAEAYQNKMVDILAYANYDMSKTSLDAILGNSTVAEGIMAGGLGMTADQIQNIIDAYSVTEVEKTAYDKLYVDRGLVALYSAYETDSAEGDASILLSDGMIIGWVDKVNQNIATVAGSFTANSNGDGGFGTSRWTAAEWNKESGTAGVTFDANYVRSDNFTVETAISLNSLSDATGTQYSGGRTQLRVDLFALTMFIGNSGSNNHQIRGVLSYANWSSNGNHNGATDTIGFAGQTSGYRADTFNYVNDKINSMVFIKDTNADTSITLVYTFNASRRANTTITAAQYQQQKNYRNPTDGLLSLLNGTPGDLYAVRVYNVALTTAEQRQNKLVDLLAYTGADLTNYPTEPTQLALLADLVAEKGWSFDTANLKAYLETAMANGMVKVTYTDELTGATLTSFSAVKGDFLALPSTVGNKTIVKWNADFEEIELTEDITVSAMTINTPTASNNVSIRVDTTEGAEDVGLRFTSTLSKASYGDLTIKYGADNIKLGMLISTEAIVKGAGAFTKADLDAYAAGNAAYVDIALAGYYQLAENGDYVMAGVLTNIKDKTIANNVAFVSVLYIEIDTDDDGSYDTVVYGTASAAKTVAAVADAVKANIDAADVESGLTAEAEATFNTWYAAKFPVAAE